MKYLLGTKQNMTQIFDKDGNVSPVTLIAVEPQAITFVRTKEKDGYQAVQVGYGDRKAKNVSKPVLGHTKGKAFKKIKEFRFDDATGAVGDAITVDAFAEGDIVEVSGISKGKGFQGVVKRHGFKGGPRSHGQKHSEREPGSIGGAGRDGGRVAKGKRMAGRMGGDRVTVKNLKVVMIDKESNQIYIKGAIPGRRGTLLEIRGQSIIMDAKIYSKDGKAKGSITLPEEIFGLSWNADLVHEVVSSLMTSARTPVAHTKDRGDVRGGGKKPWQQKGTGRARHGSTRSPIWVGGGVAHGPRNDKNFDRKINKKVKAKAIATILSAKLRDDEIVFVDSFGMSSPKTKDAVEVLKNLGAMSGFEKLSKKKTNAALITTAEKDMNVSKSFSNIGKVSVSEIRNMNPLDLMKYKFLVIENPEKSVEVIKSRLVK